MLNYNCIGIKKIVGVFTPFDVEFQPFIEEINTKEDVIRKYADAATMERIKSMVSTYTTVKSALWQSNSKVYQTLKVSLKILHQN